MAARGVRAAVGDVLADGVVVGRIMNAARAGRRAMAVDARLWAS